MTVLYRVERLNQRTGLWRQISPEGIGALDACRVRFACEKEGMKRGSIRITGNDGSVVEEYTA